MYVSEKFDLDPEQRISLARVLPSLTVHPLEPDHTPVEAFVLIKLLDSNGEVGWASRTTRRLDRAELLNALTAHVATLTKELQDESPKD